MNNLKELEKKYEELGKEIERLKKEQGTVGFKNDPILLLSEEEVTKYIDKIPSLRCWWWSQSWNDSDDPALKLILPSVSDSSEISKVYHDIDGTWYKEYRRIWTENIGVRPVLNLTSPILLAHFTRNLGCGETHKTRLMDIVGKDTIVFCGVTWVKIDTYLYISEVPIAFRRFDEESNNYETSEVRKFLLNWFEERQELN